MKQPDEKFARVVGTPLAILGTIACIGGIAAGFSGGIGGGLIGLVVGPILVYWLMIAIYMTIWFIWSGLVWLSEEKAEGATSEPPEKEDVAIGLLVIVGIVVGIGGLIAVACGH